MRGSEEGGEIQGGELHSEPLSGALTSRSGLWDSKGEVGGVRGQNFGSPGGELGVKTLRIRLGV